MSKWFNFEWDKGWSSFFIMIVILSILPLVLPYVSLATEIVCFSLLAISFNMLFGYGGLLSFAHAAFFSIGAYTIGNLMIHFKVHIVLGLLAGGTMAALIAFPIGIISIQRIGIYFAFLTLAFNELVYYIIYESVSITGGDEGLRGIPRPGLNLGIFSIDLAHPIKFYFFALIVFALCFYFIRKVINSPFGRVLKSIKDNENRAEAIGYRVKSYKLMIVVISAFFAGIAGALHTMFIKFADVEHCMWIFSGDVILMTLLGGVKSLFGPMFGVVIFVLLSDFLSALWERWLFIVGLIFLASVMFFRGGIEGIIQGLYPKEGFKRKMRNSF